MFYSCRTYVAQLIEKLIVDCLKGLMHDLALYIIISHGNPEHHSCSLGRSSHIEEGKLYTENKYPVHKIKISLDYEVNLNIQPLIFPVLSSINDISHFCLIFKVSCLNNIALLIRIPRMSLNFPVYTLNLYIYIYICNQLKIMAIG